MCDFTIGTKVVAFLSLLTGVALGIGCFVIFAWEEQLQTEISQISAEIKQLEINSIILPKVLLKAPSIPLLNLPSLPGQTGEAKKEFPIDDYVLEPTDKRFKRNSQPFSLSAPEEQNPIIFRDEPLKYFDPGDTSFEENRLTFDTTTSRPKSVHYDQNQRRTTVKSFRTTTKTSSIFFGQDSTTELTNQIFVSTSTHKPTSTFLDGSSSEMSTSTSSGHFLSRQNVEALKKLLFGTSVTTSRTKPSTESENEDKIIFREEEEETTVTVAITDANSFEATTNEDRIVFRDESTTEATTKNTLMTNGDETAIIFRDESTTEEISTSTNFESASEFPTEARFNIPEKASAGTTEKIQEGQFLEKNNSVQKVKLPNQHVSPEHLEMDWRQRIQPIIFGLTGVSAVCGALMVLISAVIMCSSDKACRKYTPYWIGCHVVIGVAIVICLVVIVTVCERFDQTMQSMQDQRSIVEAKILRIVSDAKHLCTLFYIVDGSAIGILFVLVLINLCLVTCCRKMDMYASAKEMDRLLKEQAKINERFY